MARSVRLPAPTPLLSPAATRRVLCARHRRAVESTKLAFDATNEVLVGAGRPAVTVDDYKIGCRYTTPERFNFHLGRPEGDAEGARLGQVFDETYVARVSRETAGLFDGLEPLLRALSLAGHPQGVLSNACGAYVRAVMSANLLDEVPGERLAVMKVALSATASRLIERWKLSA